jgi:predicted enzyme involved in methoxymalonyl-ACP biosynthesis
VKDRFAAYGVVGLCVVAGDRIENICISCRTIGLHVEHPFVAAVIANAGLHARRTTGRIVIGERNQPSRRVFLDAEFADIGDGVFAREPTRDVPTIDRTIYSLAVRDESELSVFD